jgi:lipopolysaccharide export system permease protein
VIRILDRLVFKTFLKLFVLMLVASPPLFVIGDIAENLDDYLDRGLTGAEVAKSYLYKLPLFIEWSFPIAALLAAVFTVHSMTTHREIVAAKAGGISFHRLIAPLLVSAIGLTIVALGLSEVVPRGNRIAAQILRSESPGRSWRSDFVYQSEGGLTWQVSRLTAMDGRMSDVVLERPQSEGRSGLHVLAEAASYTEADGWTLSQGYLRHLKADSTERTLEFDRMRMPEISEKPRELLEMPRQPEEMTYSEIDDLAKIVERTGGDASDLLVKREQKLSIPVATLVIILFGAPLATSNKRGGAAYGIGLSLATVLVYMMMLKVTGALGGAGAISPLTAAWLPNGVFGVAGLIMMSRVRT